MLTLESSEENFPYTCPLCANSVRLKRNKNDKNLLDGYCPKCKLKISVLYEDWEEEII